MGEGPGPGCASPKTSLLLGAGRKESGSRYLAAKSPAANEPGEARAIFSSRSSGRLIAAAASRQAAMETLNATAGSSNPARPGPRGPPPSPVQGRPRCRGRRGVPVPSRTAAGRPGGASAARWAFEGEDTTADAEGGCLVRVLAGPAGQLRHRLVPTVLGALVSHL